MEGLACQQGAIDVQGCCVSTGPQKAPAAEKESFKVGVF